MGSLHPSRSAAQEQQRKQYQVMLPLSVEDYAVLKADIAARGVLVPVEYDDDGNVLDGHHRLKACAELGISDWPRIVRPGWSEEEKRQHARQLNIARRHLTHAQKRGLIAFQIKEAPEKSNRQIAAGLGVDDKTVGVVREGLEATAEIPQLSKRVGTDGKERRQPARPALVPKSRTERPPNGGAGLRVVRDVEFRSDPDFAEAAEEAARDLEVDRDTRIIMSGTGHIFDENEALRKQVALLDRRIASLLEENGSLKYREKLWKERALAAGWKARADA